MKTSFLSPQTAAVFDTLAEIFRQRKVRQSVEAISSDDQARQLVIELAGLVGEAEKAGRKIGTEADEIIGQLDALGFDEASIEANVAVYRQRVRLCSLAKSATRLSKVAREAEQAFAEAKDEEGRRRSEARRALRLLEQQANQAAQDSAAALAARGDLGSTQLLPPSTAQLTCQQNELRDEIEDAEKRLDPAGYRLEDGRYIHLDGMGCPGRLVEVLQRRRRQAEADGQPTHDLDRQLEAAIASRDAMTAKVAKLRKQHDQLTVKSQKAVRSDDPAAFALVRPSVKATPRNPSAAEGMLQMPVKGFA